MPDCITITARENPVRLNSIQSRVINRKTPRALVAQLDRVLASEAKGRGFDSRRARHFSKVRTGHIGNTLYRRHG